jgi:hypothetical protein
MQQKTKVIIAVIIIFIATIVAAVFLYRKPHDGLPAEVTRKSAQLAVDDKKVDVEKAATRPTSFDIDPVEGTVIGVSDDNLVLLTDSGERTVRVTADHAISLVGDGDQAKIGVTDLKKGSNVKIIYNGPVTLATNYIASDVKQGTVTAIGDKSVTIKTDADEKTLEIIPATSIYFKVGSLVTVAYSDQVDRLVAVGIRIDKL